MANEQIKVGDIRVAVREERGSMWGERSVQPVELVVRKIYAEQGYRSEYLLEDGSGTRGVVTEAFLRLVTKRAEARV